MSIHHIPKLKPTDIMMTLKSFKVIVNEGRVISAKGYEYCNIDRETRRVNVNIWSKIHKRNFVIFRYHIIWWKATGSWPTQLVDHIDGVSYHDWFSNLQYLSQKQNIQKCMQGLSQEWVGKNNGNLTPWASPKIVGKYGSPWLKRSCLSG